MDRDGHPPMDLADVDIRRMQPFQSNARYLRERVIEGLGLLYAMHWPYRQYATARPARTSPFHERLKARGACFAEAAGWERPGWFAPPGARARYAYAYGHRLVRALGDEHLRRARARRPVRSVVLRQVPPAGARCEERCCSASAPTTSRSRPAGSVYTPWLNERGGIEADLTVTRLAADAYLVVTSAASQNRDLHWLRRNLPDDAHAIATDVTSAFAVLALMGPKAGHSSSR